MFSRLGSFDCEDMRDFGQYYRHRYFGVMVNGVIKPAFFERSGNGGVTYCEFNGTDTWEPKISPVEEFKNIGRFGFPTLGNVDIGPTFVYMSGSPRRESAKGIHLGMVRTTFPDHGGLSAKAPDLLDIYMRQKGKEYRHSMSGDTYGHKVDGEIMMQVYNRKYTGIRQAIAALEAGERLGTSLDHKTGLYLSGSSENIQISFRGEHAGELTTDRFGHFVPEIVPELTYARRLIRSAVGA